MKHSSPAARFGVYAVRPVVRPAPVNGVIGQLTAYVTSGEPGEVWWVDEADHTKVETNAHGSWTNYITFFPEVTYRLDYPNDLPQMSLSEASDTNVWGTLRLWAYSNEFSDPNGAAQALAQLNGWGYTENQTTTQIDNGANPYSYFAYGEQEVRQLRRLNDDTLRWKYEETDTSNTARISLHRPDGGTIRYVSCGSSFTVLVEKRERYPTGGGGVTVLLPNGAFGPPPDDTTDLLVNDVEVASYDGAQNATATPSRSFDSHIGHWGKTDTDVKRRKKIAHEGWSADGQEPRLEFAGATFSGDGVISDALTVTVNALVAHDVRYIG